MEETPKTQEQELKEAMDKHGEIKYQVDALKSSKQSAIDRILEKYPEVRAEIDEVEDEIGLKVKQAEATEKKSRKQLDRLIENYALVAPVKDVLDFKSNTMKVRYTKVVTYDASAMDGLATENPKILAFRTEVIKPRLEMIKE